MILESRSLILSDDEVYVALSSLMEEQGVTSEMTASKIETTMNDEGDVIVIIAHEETDAPLTFEGKELGTAILNHCIARGIPLPRGSYKELTIRGDFIALIVRLETNQPSSDIDVDEE